AVGTASTVIVLDSSAPVGPGMTATPVSAMESPDPLLAQALRVASDTATIRGYISLPIRFGWPMSITCLHRSNMAAPLPGCQECHVCRNKVVRRARPSQRHLRLPYWDLN